MSADELRVSMGAQAHRLCADEDGVPTGVTSSLLDTTWIYKDDDPYALHVLIFHDDDVTTWTLSRESVTCAVQTVANRVGQGDTLLANYGLHQRDITILTLRSPYGTRELTFDTLDLVELLACSEEMVQPGTESERVIQRLERELFGPQP